MRKLVVPILLLAVILIIAGRFARPLYHHYKEQHGVQMARLYLRRGEYTNDWKNLQRGSRPLPSRHQLATQARGTGPFGEQPTHARGRGVAV